MSVSSPFNTPLETGVRLTIILVEAYPSALSLDQLVMLDHILVHTEDFGGPSSVHPASPYRVAEPYVRRELVQRSLQLFCSRELIAQTITSSGFLWQADDSAGPFIETLSTSYHNDVKARASWTMENFGSLSETRLAAFMGERVVSAIGIEVAS